MAASHVKLLLTENVDNLGIVGDVVRVRTGYARNYLLPQKKALRATKDNMAHFDGQRAQLEAQNLERRNEAEAAAAKMEGLSCVLVRQASDMGQLYGSVSSRDIADALSEAGVKIEKRQVSLDRPIKTLGIHGIRIVLHPEVFVQVDVNVARSEAEAEQQAAEASDLFEDEEAAAAAEAEAEEAMADADTDTSAAADDDATEPEADTPTG